jgi:hypothetical protein
MRGNPIYTTSIPISVVRERALAEKRADLDQELKPLGLRIVNADRGFAIADTDGNIVQGGTEFFSHDDAQRCADVDQTACIATCSK